MREMGWLRFGEDGRRTRGVDCGGGRLGCVACYWLDGFDVSVVSAGRRRRRKIAGTLIVFRWRGGCMYGWDIGMWEVGE